MTGSSPIVLVVDDEQQLLALTSYALRTAGMEVVEAQTGAEAMAAFDEYPVDLVVLDVLLPDANGFDLCRRIRRRSEAPVLFLTVRSDQEDVIAGLQAGGDDYLAKPFSVQELLLRVSAILRRTHTAERELQVGDLRLVLESHSAFANDIRIDFTPLEFRFVKYLALNADRIIPTTELVEEVWEVSDLGAHDPIVKSVVYRIRQKLRSVPGMTVTIRNVRSVGYQIAPSD